MKKPPPWPCRPVKNLHEDAGGSPPRSFTASNVQTAGREDYQARKEQAANLRRLQNRLQKLENAISEGEAEKAELENQLAAPELASDYQQAAALHSQLQQVQQRLEEAMAEWEQVALALEETEE